ncbi:MAG TPA: tRNA-dihydrouridine synthase family protein [Anaerolineales bacterium]|jgi:nifR3 family TIM-barrel protein
MIMIQPDQNTKIEQQPVFKVRDVPVYGDAILAPMDGFSDWPFRSLCHALGSAMSYTEFVRAQHIVHAYEHMAARLTYEEAERPVVFQIYGDDVDELLAAALRVQDRHPDILDINMGCPARKVVHHGAGVGLMRQPLKVARIFRKLSAALPIPVTGKIRLGWEDCRSYKLIARIVEENGGSLIAVHGRTKEQAYSGQANWDAIAEIKAAVKIPVIANGDVKMVADIDRLKAYTGCEAVMVGRAAIGNPWIFSRLDREQVPEEMVHKMVRQHLERHLAFYGAYKGMVLFRKHALQYLKLQHLPRAVRTRIITRQDPAEFLALLDEAFAQTYPEEFEKI